MGLAAANGPIRVVVSLFLMNPKPEDFGISSKPDSRVPTTSFLAFEAERIDLLEKTPRIIGPDAIAKEVSFAGQVDESIVRLVAGRTPEELEACRRAVGSPLDEMLEVLNRIHEQHHSIKPPGLD